ncbi:XRE family transcriptional regulator [Streptococcus satellite phage Javan373]|uniref:helix-turn-helix domain-containing protein n=1 Tax=Streptococcus parasanguinis TaxID=1318 RepID=UPI00066DA1D2|nr:helix-turn-helix transcriptional regulator [Streptococcus parasanguinis]QBX09705.1 XRE family transcriptional regulator [Streptococcus satellite phage Javan373]
MNKIKNLRESKGLSQDRLSQELGINLRTLQRWENGETAIRSKNINRIADYFNVTVPELLGYEDFYKIEREALESSSDISEKLNDPNYNRIILEYNESNKKNGKFVLLLSTETDAVPLIEKSIEKVILDNYHKLQDGDYEESLTGILSEDITNTYIALSFLPIPFNDFFSKFLTLSNSDKKIVLKLVSSLHDKDDGLGIIKEQNDLNSNTDN